MLESSGTARLVSLSSPSTLGSSSRLLRLNALWWARLLVLFPILLLQAKQFRKHVARLPEASGSRFEWPSPSASARTFRVAIIGESTAVGVGADTLDEALPGHLARALAVRTGKRVAWQVLGGNGMTLERVLSSVRTDGRGSFDAAVVLVGVNDVFHMTPVRQWAANLLRLASLLKGQGCGSVVFSALPPIGSFPALPEPLRSSLGLRAALLDHQLALLARELPGVTHCNVEFPSDPRYVATDGMHPSAAGYGEWAEQLARQIPCA
jgi:lysophospholipase L1-like esterase